VSVIHVFSALNTTGTRLGRARLQSCRLPAKQRLTCPQGARAPNLSELRLTGAFIVLLQAFGMAEAMPFPTLTAVLA